MFNWGWGRKLISLNRIEISKRAILANFEYFQKVTGQEIWPVLKSNAYGHGLEQVVEILKVKKPTYVVADSYYEALRIWKVNKQQRVLIMGSIHPDNLARLDYSKIALMVQDRETVERLGSLNKYIKVHLKVDTGMSRQGVEIKNLKEMINELKKHKNIEVEGLMSHLADADNEDESFTKEQITKFEEIKQLVWESKLTPKYWHLAATAGAGKMPKGLTNIVRLGIGLYLGKAAAMRMVSTITLVKTIEKGERVSYNGIYEAPKKMQIGVVPMGYFEGLDRRLSNKGVMKIRGKEVPILGRVCMNLTVVGLGENKAKMWDEVEVISSRKGDKNSVEEIAKICETIPYEILVGLDQSIRRVIIE